SPCLHCNGTEIGATTQLTEITGPYFRPDTPASVGLAGTSTVVLDEKDKELCRLRAARVPADRMNVVGTFIKRLPGRERDFLTALHLHHNRAFQNINERMRVVPVNRILRTRRIHYHDHQTFLAGTLRQIF